MLKKVFTVGSYNASRIIGFDNTGVPSGQSLCYLISALQIILHTPLLMEFVTTGNETAGAAATMRLLMDDISLIYGHCEPAVPTSVTVEIQQRLGFDSNPYSMYDVVQVLGKIVRVFPRQKCDDLGDWRSVVIFFSENVVVLDSWGPTKKKEEIEVCNRKYVLHACAWFQDSHWIAFANTTEGWKKFDDDKVSSETHTCLQEGSDDTTGFAKNVVFTLKP